jgi:hypothetical protein
MSMKAWLAKFRISAAQDAGKPLPPSVQRQLAGSDELRRFKEDTAALDRALRQVPAPETEPEPTLHAAIMGAVRAAERRPASPRPFAFLRWLPAPALATVAVLGVWWLLHRPVATPVPTLAIAATALEMSDTVAQGLPSTVMAPLSEEWQRLNSDLDNTAQFLLASLP